MDRRTDRPDGSGRRLAYRGDFASFRRQPHRRPGRPDERLHGTAQAGRSKQPGKSAPAASDDTASDGTAGGGVCRTARRRAVERKLPPTAPRRTRRARPRTTRSSTACPRCPPTPLDPRVRSGRRGPKQSRPGRAGKGQPPADHSSAHSPAPRLGSQLRPAAVRPAPADCRRLDHRLFADARREAGRYDPLAPGAHSSAGSAVPRTGSAASVSDRPARGRAAVGLPGCVRVGDA